MSKYPICFKRRQQGFTIVMAIFILVVLGLLGVYMVRFSGVQHATTAYALQGARAYQAAKAGLGWAIEKISAGGGTCADVSAQTALTLPNLTGFTVKLACTLTTYLEGSDSYGIYQINAHSEFGTYGGADYVSRELEVSIVK
jgi:MSHA biogenesis protein MshP